MDNYGPLNLTVKTVISSKSMDKLEKMMRQSETLSIVINGILETYDFLCFLDEASSEVRSKLDNGTYFLYDNKMIFVKKKTASVHVLRAASGVANTAVGILGKAA